MTSTGIALKLLSISDLTFFAYFARTSPGHQKSVNLNADIFINAIYPGLTERRSILISLDIIGPGGKRPVRFTRKIIRSPGSKNWRLNGEVIPDPDDDPTRFRVLRPDDLAVMKFEGDPLPRLITLVLVSRSDDADMWQALFNPQLSEDGRATMVLLDDATLRAAYEATIASYPSNAHPLQTFIEDETLTTVVLPVPPERSPDGRGPAVDQETLARQIDIANDTGLLGEQLVDRYLDRLQNQGVVESYEWISLERARASYDFSVTWSNRTAELLDVKTTRGDYAQRFYVSRAEFIFAQNASVPYHIYRVYDATTASPKLVVIEDVKETFQRIHATLSTCPAGATIELLGLLPALFEKTSQPLDLTPLEDSSEP